MGRPDPPWRDYSSFLLDFFYYMALRQRHLSRDSLSAFVADVAQSRGSDLYRVTGAWRCAVDDGGVGGV